MLIFCLVLFLYLHIFFHLKTSEDLEIYEIEQPSKDKLEEICDLRQPVRFDFQSEKLNSCCSRQIVLDTYGAFDIKIRNVKDKLTDEDELFVPLPFNSALQVMKDDITSQYLVESNQDFLEETGLIKSFRYNDAFIRPYMVSNCYYDYILASKGTQTPLRYELNYRNYLLVLEGSIKVKLAPPKSAKYLYQIRDYENFEFRSPINPWSIQQEYKADFDKIKWLEVVVPKGQILFIPAFWWYSIEFDNETTLTSFKYRTYMNNIAILPKLLMRFLQTQNVKRQIVSKIDTKKIPVINIDDKQSNETVSMVTPKLSENPEAKIVESESIHKKNV